MEMLPDVWKQEFWLPPGIGWQDMERLADSDRPLPRDLVMALPLALGFLGLRFMFERFCAPPMARCLGVRSRARTSAAPCPRLESFYTEQNRNPSQSEIYGLMSSCGKTQRQIEVWFRLRRNQDRPCRTKKFSEAAWRFFFYLTAFIGGLACLVDRPWLWDHRECWEQYPLQPLESAHYWYYMLELGFYGSLLLRISVDIKRKDFKEQVIHHFATMFLLGFSYCANYVRVGTLVMLLHDSADILLESAKMLNYGTGWRRHCDALFILFAAVFFVTRLVLFPSRIIHTTLVLSMEIFEPFFGYYFFNVLLMVLQVLHIFWAGLILRMLYKFTQGKLHKDERSDEESEVEEEEEAAALVRNEAETEDYCWERRKDTLESKLSTITNGFVLDNLTNHRTSAVNRMRKAQ